jgi:hypothetical protein
LLILKNGKYNKKNISVKNHFKKSNKAGNVINAIKKDLQLKIVQIVIKICE